MGKVFIKIDPSRFVLKTEDFTVNKKITNQLLLKSPTPFLPGIAKRKNYNNLTFGNTYNLKIMRNMKKQQQQQQQKGQTKCSTEKAVS